MSREEEIKQAAKNRADQYEHPVDWNNCYHHYIQGAKWADQNPMKGLWDAEKVIEWIKNNFSCSGHGFPLHYLHTSYQPEDIVKDLCKAMED